MRHSCVIAFLALGTTALTQAPIGVSAARTLGKAEDDVTIGQLKAERKQQLEGIERIMFSLWKTSVKPEKRLEELEPVATPSQFQVFADRMWRVAAAHYFKEVVHPEWSMARTFCGCLTSRWRGCGRCLSCMPCERDRYDESDAHCCDTSCCCAEEEYEEGEFFESWLRESVDLGFLAKGDLLHVQSFDLSAGQGADAAGEAANFAFLHKFYNQRLVVKMLRDMRAALTMEREKELLARRISQNPIPEHGLGPVVEIEIENERYMDQSWPVAKSRELAIDGYRYTIYSEFGESEGVKLYQHDVADASWTRFSRGREVRCAESKRLLKAKIDRKLNAIAHEQKVLLAETGALDAEAAEGVTKDDLEALKTAIKEEQAEREQVGPALEKALTTVFACRCGGAGGDDGGANLSEGRSELETTVLALLVAILGAVLVCVLTCVCRRCCKRVRTKTRFVKEDCLIVGQANAREFLLADDAGGSGNYNGIGGNRGRRKVSLDARSSHSGREPAASPRRRDLPASPRGGAGRPLLAGQNPQGRSLYGAAGHMAPATIREGGVHNPLLVGQDMHDLGEDFDDLEQEEEARPMAWD